MIEKIKKYKWVLAAFVITAMFWGLGALKTGWHVDEIFSYAHASSSEGAYFNGHSLNPKSEENHQWIKGEAIHDYITVQDAERFHYQHIFDNLKVVEHPPLYFLILHTMRSFLAEGLGKGVGLCLNYAVLFLLLMWFYQLAGIVLRDKNWTFGATLFLAFLPIVMEMSVFIRGYLLELALFIGLLGQTLPLIDEQKISAKCGAKILCFAVLCYLTHFYGLIYAFFLSVAMCFCFLWQKKYKMLLAYALLMLFSVVLVMMIYPYYLEVLLFSDRGEEALGAVNLFSWSLWDAYFEFMLKEIAKAFFFMDGLSWAVLLGLIILFWKAKFDVKGKILLFTGFVSLLLMTVIAPNMGNFNGRYHVVSMVVLYLAVVCALYEILKNVRQGGKWLSGIAVILAGINLVMMLHSPYLGRTSEISKIADLVKGKRVFMQRQYFISIFALSPALQNADAVYIMFSKDKVDEIVLSPEFNTGSILIFVSGMNDKKYKSKATLAQNPKLGLKFIGQYTANQCMYDIYEKI